MEHQVAACAQHLQQSESIMQRVTQCAGWMFGILFIRAESERAQRDGSPPNQFAPRAHQAKEFGRYIVFSSSSFDTARIKIIICAHTNSPRALRERHNPPTRRIPNALIIKLLCNTA